jgi:hypothetical protein
MCFPNVHVLLGHEFDALITCGVVISSTFANKVRSSSVLKGRKDYGMTA